MPYGLKRYLRPAALGASRSWCSRPAGRQAELFFDDEPNHGVAENALQRVQLAKGWDSVLRGYRKRAQAIGAGDDVVVSIAGNPDRRNVPPDGRAWGRVMQQLRNLGKQLLGHIRLGKEGIREHAQLSERGLELSADGNGRDLRESRAHHGEQLEA